ncbi:hypothetical protein [Pseudomonas sp. PD9R]|uniref:hypothetical protein n=1 Tax=Pseudomonas sp. PD9R TaxID=2853534 RepID=UPI001C460D61|nr:hypothetical protein [Pseudomonas sp. PD9R]MBV6826123.1 hypothetical protein [Pseudomonas sp. PD9R]
MSPAWNADGTRSVCSPELPQSSASLFFAVCRDRMTPLKKGLNNHLLNDLNATTPVLANAHAPAIVYFSPKGLLFESLSFDSCPGSRHASFGIHRATG